MLFYSDEHHSQVISDKLIKAEEMQYQLRQRILYEQQRWQPLKSTLAVCSSLEGNMFIFPLIMLQLIFTMLKLDSFGPVGHWAWQQVLWPAYIFDVILLVNFITALLYTDNRWYYLYDDPPWDVENGMYLHVANDLCATHRMLSRINLGTGTFSFILFTVLLPVKGKQEGGVA